MNELKPVRAYKGVAIYNVGQFEVWVSEVDYSDYPLISVYHRNEHGTAEWVNSLQIALNGRIIGWSPAGSSVTKEVHEVAIKLAKQAGAWEE